MDFPILSFFEASDIRPALLFCMPRMFDDSGCESRSNLMEVKDSRPQGRHREVRSESRV